MHFSTPVVAAFAATVYGANVNVAVGKNNGLTFTPSNIQAAVGDTIQFQFQNANHTATAGTPNQGCAPGGQFYSGFAQVNGNPTRPPTQTGIPVANGFAVNNGNNNNGQTNNGQTNNGQTNNGQTNNGQTNNGQTNNGANTGKGGKAGKGNNKFKIRGAEWFDHNVERDVELDKRDPVVFVEARDGGVMEIRQSGGATFSVPVTAQIASGCPVYCSQQLHCQQGMVAYINGNQQQLQQYTQLSQQAQVNVVPQGGPNGGTVQGYNPNAQAQTNNNGNTNNGQTNNGQTNNGQTNNGQANNGQTNNGQAQNGQTNNGQAQNGQTNNGQAQNGQTNNGQAQNGQTNNGQAQNGNAQQQQQANQGNQGGQGGGKAALAALLNGANKGNNN